MVAGADVVEALVVLVLVAGFVEVEATVEVVLTVELDAGALLPLQLNTGGPVQRVFKKFLEVQRDNSAHPEWYSLSNYCKCLR